MTNIHITPHLWFEKEAVEAVNFYISLFDNSGVKKISELPLDFNFNADQKVQYQTAKSLQTRFR